MRHEQKLYAAKTVLWPGATPFCPPIQGPKRHRGSGSLPATMSFPRLEFSTQVCQPESVVKLLTDRHTSLSNPRGLPPRLLVRTIAPRFHPRGQHTETFLPSCKVAPTPRLSRLTTASRRTFVRP
jgi:hypothetical protein